MLMRWYKRIVFAGGLYCMAFPMIVCCTLSSIDKVLVDSGCQGLVVSEATLAVIADIEVAVFVCGIIACCYSYYNWRISENKES